MDESAGLVTLRRYWVSGLREHFMLDQELCRDWVLLAPMSGTFSFEIAGVSANSERPIAGECGFGDLVLCPPGSELHRRMLTPTCFCFAEFTVDRHFPIGMSTIQDRRRLKSTFDYMAEIRDRRWGGLGFETRHLVADVLLMIARTHTIALRPDDLLARQAAQRIEELAYEPELSLARLARELSISPSQLSRRFRAAYGVAPIEYCTEVRLTQARQLLLDTDRPVAAIAAECGYASAFYFSRVFSRRVGQSPTAFRAGGQV